MIRELRSTDIIGLNNLPPNEWKYDYEDLLKQFIDEDFFYAFVKIHDQKIVGTGNIFLKGKVAWLANIIVSKNQREKGFGYEITEFLIDFIQNKGCETQILIATELGERVYKKFAFKKMAEYQGYDSEVDQEFKVSNSIRNLTWADLDSVTAMDQRTNSEDRSGLLQKFYKNGLGYFSNNDVLLGFYLPEFGKGLIIAESREAGETLLKLKHSSKNKRSYIPTDNIAGMQFLEDIGLKKAEKCTRMILGKQNHWTPQNIYSFGSGYCG